MRRVAPTVIGTVTYLRCCSNALMTALMESSKSLVTSFLEAQQLVTARILSL